MSTDANQHPADAEPTDDDDGDELAAIIARLRKRGRIEWLRNEDKRRRAQ